MKFCGSCGINCVRRRTKSRFGKEVRRLAENPFQRQLEEARREWKAKKEIAGFKRNRTLKKYVQKKIGTHWRQMAMPPHHAVSAKGTTSQRR